MTGTSVEEPDGEHLESLPLRFGKKPRVAVVGSGRAGSAYAEALKRARWDVHGFHGRGDLAPLSADHDIVLLCVPDGAVAEVAAGIEPHDGVVTHVAGSLTLDPLEQHRHRGSVHPLMALPAGPAGSERIRSGGWFAVAAEPWSARLLLLQIPEALDGRCFSVPDEHRARYHAAAAIAANHVTVLLDQVERIARQIGMPAEPFYDLARGSLENAAALGALDALTGPASRGDEATVAAHREALSPADRALYDALAHRAAEMGRQRSTEE